MGECLWIYEKALLDIERVSMGRGRSFIDTGRMSMDGGGGSIDTGRSFRTEGTLRRHRASVDQGRISKDIRRASLIMGVEFLYIEDHL